jgi:uncharacterized protein YerC
MVKKDQEQLRAAKMADALSENRGRDFWLEAKRIRSSKKGSFVNVVDDRVGEREISEVFGEKYRQLYQSVPYDVTEMAEFKDYVEGRVSTHCDASRCYCSHVVRAYDVKNALNQMKMNKNDGGLGLWSNHLMHGPPRLHILLSLLFTSMLKHGHVPHEFKVSTLLPIPKDLSKSVHVSDNYRPIALSSVVCKVFDHIILDKHKNSLCSSGLQHGFKKKHSTVTCSFVLQEVIEYYRLNGSTVYNVFLDASRAFDRVHYTKLFKLLLKRNVCPLVIRFLIVMYTNQSIRVRWAGETSENYGMCNGVRQGGVLSPLLFAVYIDEMLNRLKEADIGCHIGREYLGALAYADDICLVAPSVDAMNQMLHVCEKFAHDYYVKFNPHKSALVVHKPSGSSNCCIDKVNRCIKFMNECVPLVDSYKHLGIYIGKNAQQSCISNAASQLYGRTNVINAQFRFAQQKTLYFLFKTYCVHMYGCELWDISSRALSTYATAFRKCQRNVLNVPYRTHCKYLPFLCNDKPAEFFIYNRIVNFLRYIYVSDNHAVQSLSRNLFQFGSTSCIGNSLSQLCYIFHINRRKILNNFVLPIDHFIDFDVPQEKIDFILDTLDNIRHCNSIMTRSELNDILFQLCTE